MPISFFTSRLGDDVVRIAPDGHKTIVRIESYKQAEYLHELQDNGYLFKENFVVHSSPSLCLSCEG